MAENLRLFLSDVSDQPLYNIKAVGKRTGITTATLRAWERRYGLPQPSRTHHGYRLYSERDIVVVEWLQRRLQAGATIAHATSQVEQLTPTASPSNGDSARLRAAVTAGSPTTDPSRLSPLSTMMRSDIAGHFFDEVRSPLMLREALIRAALGKDQMMSISHVIDEALALYTRDTTLLTIVYGAVQTLRARPWSDGQETRPELAGINDIAQQLANRVRALWELPPDRDTVVLVGFAQDQTEIERSVIEWLLHCKKIRVNAVTLDPSQPVEQGLEPLRRSLMADARAGLIVWYTNNVGYIRDFSNHIASDDGCPCPSMAWGSVAPLQLTADQVTPLTYLGDTLRTVIQYIIIDLTLNPLKPGRVATAVRKRGRRRVR